MSRALSVDLRDRVIRAISGGMPRRQAHRIRRFVAPDRRTSDQHEQRDDQQRDRTAEDRPRRGDVLLWLVVLGA